MEHNSLGSFIAALRKASGMTQKDLADRLHVSDKTVSRWERDDGAPDLSVIPVLAEIFGVTCDELLRGRRNAPAQQVQGELTEEKPSPKATKERQRLMKTALTWYSTFTYIAMGIAVLGLIVALICNLVFYRGTLGFLLGIVFLAASVICQAIAITRALADLDEDLLTPEECITYRERVFRLASLSFGCTAALLGFTAPMLLAGSLHGLAVFHVFLYGFLGALVSSVLFRLIRGLAVVPKLVRRGFLIQTEEDRAKISRNRKLIARCSIVLAVMWVITGVCLEAVVNNPYRFAKMITFTDYDSFVAFMEEPRGEQGFGYSSAPAASADGSLSEEVRTLEDADGNILCSYHPRNQDIVYTIYSDNPSLLPIQVCTKTEYNSSVRITTTLSYVCCGAFVLETIAALAFYWLRRAR